MQRIWVEVCQVSSPKNRTVLTRTQDVFKSLYDSGRLLESRGADSDGKRSFQAILHFIRESFGETDQDQGTFQRPHFRVSRAEGTGARFKLLIETGFQMVPKETEYSRAAHDFYHGMLSCSAQNCF